MRKTLLIVFSLVMLTNVSAQTPKDITHTYKRDIDGDKLRVFLDSLNREILIDTAKFNALDLVFTTSGRRNKKPYSKLFVINGTYLYKLDIINGSEVLEFLNEVLDYKKIKSLSYIDSSKSSEYFGPNAWQGVIVITISDSAKFNPKIAGLTLRKNKSGDNFTTKKEGEILIRD